MRGHRSSSSFLALAPCRRAGCRTVTGPGPSDPLDERQDRIAAAGRRVATYVRVARLKAAVDSDAKRSPPGYPAGPGLRHRAPRSQGRDQYRIGLRSLGAVVAGTGEVDQLARRPPG